jgi:hypothetical protein
MSKGPRTTGHSANPEAGPVEFRDEADRSVRPVIEHALTVYFDGNSELARTLIDRLLDEDRSH